MAALPAETEGSEAVARHSELFEGLSNLGLIRQLGLMIGLAASVAIGVAVVLWSQSEEYTPLYTNLDRMDPTDVLNVLQSSELKYKIDNNTGALLVQSDQIYDARLKMAGAGISPDGSFGFEILDKEQPLGTSQFMENARFKRGLEGELARTISSIRKVRSARVHLAIPKTSTFIRDTRRPTASVFLNLYSSPAINTEQVRAIVNLVASSIPELAMEDVTVVDQRGNLLSNFAVDESMAAANRQLEYTQQIEVGLVKRIHSILDPLLGTDKYRAEVSVDIDFTQVEQTDELFNPDLPSIRSEQTLEESRQGSGAGGVPGALSNQPPAEGRAPEEAAVEGGTAVGGAGSSRKQTVKNYELDRTISHTRHQVGRVRRLSVAVLVDNVSRVDAETGEKSSVSMSQEKIERLEVLVRSAVGFDVARGDSVEIINLASIPKELPVEIPVEETPIYQQPWVQNILKQLAGFLIVAFLIFGVLRPVMKSLTDSAKDIREVEAQRALGDLSGDLGGELADETVTLSGGDSMLLAGPNQEFEQQVNAVKGLVAEDPGRVAQVVKKWVASSE